MRYQGSDWRNNVHTRSKKKKDEAGAQEIERRSTTSSSKETRLRGVSALIEPRSQDDWTWTPCICGGSGCSGGCDVLTGERLAVTTPAKWKTYWSQYWGTRWCIRGRFHRVPFQQHERNPKWQWWSVRDGNCSIKSERRFVDERCCLSLIEERRNTPKEEKQRQKEVRHNKKNEKANGCPRIQSSTKYPGNQISNHKEKKDKGECITSRKGIANVFGEFIKTNLNKKSEKMKMQAALTCTTTKPKRRQERQRLRQKSCEPQSPNSKKTDPQTAGESEPKIFQRVMMKREKWWDKSSTRS